MNQQQLDVRLQPLNSNAGSRQQPVVNLATPYTMPSPSENDQAWKHFLANIPTTVSRKLTIIGILYIIIGLLNVVLEFILNFSVGVGMFIPYGHGLVLFIVGVVTLVLRRQQIYTLTSLFVLLIVQLHITIGVIVFFIYFAISVINEILECSSGTSHHYYCDDLTAFVIIIIADSIHFIFTIGLTIVTLIVIKNARRLPIIPVPLNYTTYHPQSQVTPVTFHNPNVVPVNSIN